FVVLGGGPAGLAAPHKLSQRGGGHGTLLQRGSRGGGHAGRFVVDGTPGGYRRHPPPPGWSPHRVVRHPPPPRAGPLRPPPARGRAWPWWPARAAGASACASAGCFFRFGRWISRCGCRRRLSPVSPPMRRGSRSHHRAATTPSRRFSSAVSAGRFAATSTFR